MKSFHKPALCVAVAATGLSLILARASHAELPTWMQSVVTASAIENALYRAMDLPGIRSLYPRPPAEAHSQLDALISSSPDNAKLYALRAHVDEDELEFSAAEQDWKAFAAHSPTDFAAHLELADYYRRRNAAPQEIEALKAATAFPAPSGDKFLSADRQQAWRVFPRALTVARDQTLGDDATIAIYRAWIIRYPTEPSVRANLIGALLQMHRYADAQYAITDYQHAFPLDVVFPIKASALLAFDQGSAEATARAITLFDESYKPLWPSDLLQTYFQLLDATHSQHAMLTATRAQLLQSPDNLNAATKLFAYYQHQGQAAQAVNVLDTYAASKKTRHAAWSADELFTFATVLDRASQDEQAARYYYALASSSGHLESTPQSPEEAALCGFIRILITAPESHITIGSGNLSIYSDLATVDRGPGYLNGILSLWLNSANTASEFHDEEIKAVPYFHRAKAEELLSVFDRRFPQSSSRSSLHAALIKAYVSYGQDVAAQQAGQRFLSDFPYSTERVGVALDVADADARLKDMKAEFAIYDSLLPELATNLQGMPLTAAAAINFSAQPDASPASPSEGTEDTAGSSTAPTISSANVLQQSFTFPVAPPPSAADAQAYQQVLDRYLGRLITLGQLPAALAVLRHELDRNPNDPLLYQRLADFLQKNNLDAQEEEVYKQAVSRFNTASFYDKLVRFYLRKRRHQDFSALTHKVVDVFQGTELETYFGNVKDSWPQEYLQLNLYAHQRFPHDLLFTRNLLAAYQAKSTVNPGAYEHLLREHWQESPELQTEFFEYLSRTHKLDTELIALQALTPADDKIKQNQAAALELAQAHIWQSHFEQAAPLLSALAEQYPADLTVGEQAASIFRSLAYFDPTNILTAAGIEKNLSAADPTNLDRLATIGDIYADSTSSSLHLDTDRQLTQAAPFWRRISAVHPGVENGYLQSATVFWDYFQFDDALAQIEAARKHFNLPALYAYQAGAIYEGKRDYEHAIDEYVAATISEPDSSATTSIAPAEDEQSDGGAHPRLLELAARPQFAALVDRASANAVAITPSTNALQLRVDVLNTLHRSSDISPLVESAITHATSPDQLSALATFSQTHQLKHAYQITLQREVSLASDSVQRIELQYQLAHSYEDQNNISSAQRIIESVYAENSRLVGVVRTTTDFYWNNKQPQHAIATLVQASHEANPGFAHDFTLEAIVKSNQSGDYAGARTLLQPLLASEPFNAQYLSLQAESFSLAHDDSSVRDLYTTTIAAIKAAPPSTLDAVTRRDKIALARQAMIPALTDLNDFAGATDQHIALISAFPEDDTVLQSAIAYARLHSRETQLVAFLEKTVSDSPRDSRFAIDLARVDAQLENYDAALNAYSKAISIRRDRSDLFIARADLEEHRQSFDAACADYERLYLLTYKDPQWMEKTALARARQGKPDLAIKALQTAWIDGRPPVATNYFRVARQLEQWSLLSQADAFATQGIALAGDDLFTLQQNQDGVVLYTRLLARERKSLEAISFLNKRLQSLSISPYSPAIIVKQAEEQGVVELTDSEWRKHLVETRQRQAQTTYSAAMLAMASVVAEFYTPEEKVAFAALLNTRRTGRPTQEVVDLWIPIAHSAGLLDREAAWRRDVLLRGGKLGAAQLNEFDALESARMDNTTRAETLDAYALLLKPANQTNVLTMAAKAWREAGNSQREAADLRKLVLGHQQLELQERLFSLYLRGDSTALLQLMSAKEAIANASANYLVAHSTPAGAYKAITTCTSRLLFGVRQTPRLSDSTLATPLPPSMLLFKLRSPTSLSDNGLPPDPTAPRS